MIETNLNLHTVTQKIIYTNVQDNVASLVIMELHSVQNKFDDTDSFLNS